MENKPIKAWSDLQNFLAEKGVRVKSFSRCECIGNEMTVDKLVIEIDSMKEASANGKL
jgi:hypothetical protein